MILPSLDPVLEPRLLTWADDYTPKKPTILKQHLANKICQVDPFHSLITVFPGAAVSVEDRSENDPNFCGNAGGSVPGKFCMPGGGDKAPTELIELLEKTSVSPNEVEAALTRINEQMAAWYNDFLNCFGYCCIPCTAGCSVTVLTWWLAKRTEHLGATLDHLNIQFAPHGAVWGFAYQTVETKTEDGKTKTDHKFALALAIRPLPVSDGVVVARTTNVVPTNPATVLVKPLTPAVMSGRVIGMVGDQISGRLSRASSAVLARSSMRSVDSERMERTQQEVV